MSVPSALSTRFLGLVLFVLGLLGGCTPMTDAEKEYLEQQKEEKEQADEFQTTLSDNAKINETIEKVKAWKQPDGRSAEQFVKIQRDQNPDKFMGGAWNVSQKGKDRYEVSYRYLWLDEDYNRERRGWTWSLDNTLDRITGPVEIKAERVVTRSERESRTRNLHSRDPWSLK